MDLLPGSVTGLGVLEAGAGTEGLGPRPSFSLMAGERIDVKEANIMHFNDQLSVMNLKHYLCKSHED